MKRLNRDSGGLITDYRLGLYPLQLSIIANLYHCMHNYHHDEIHETQ